MWLFLCIIAISFLLTISSDIMKYLGVSAIFTRDRTKLSQHLQDQLQKAEDEEKICKESRKAEDENYIHSIRVMRAEEKVRDARKRVQEERVKTMITSYSLEVAFKYIFKGLIYLTLMVISIRHRYTPVLVLDDDINLQPLRGLLSFPTGVANAISVPIWILSCNVTFSLFAGLIKEKKTVNNGMS